MKLSKITGARPSQARADLGDGEAIVFTYNRGAITRGWSARETSRIERLSELLISWDVTNDDGTPYQPDAHLNGERPAAWAALLEALPVDVLKCVEDALWDDFYGGKPLGGDSSAS